MKVVRRTEHQLVVMFSCPVNYINIKYNTLTMYNRYFSVCKATFCITCLILNDGDRTVVDQCFAVYMNIIIMYWYNFAVQAHE